MKTGAQAGLAIAAGYLLGRTRKLKLALTVGGMVAGRRLGGSNGLVKQGLATLRSAPQAGWVQDEVRQQLLDAGKSAAATAATGAMGRLTSRVRPAPDRAEQPDDAAQDEDEERGAERTRRTEARTEEGRTPARKRSAARPQRASESRQRSSPSGERRPHKSAPRKSPAGAAQRGRGARRG